MEKWKPELCFLAILSQITNPDNPDGGPRIPVLQAYIYLPEQFLLTTDGGQPVPKTRMSVLIPIILGLFTGLLIGIVTEYFTSHSYTPVREIAETQRTSQATGIIFGLQLGYLSTIPYPTKPRRFHHFPIFVFQYLESISISINAA